MEIKNSNAAISERIKQIRLAKNLTQQSFANALGISQGYLSEIEKGIKKPSDTLLIALQYLYAINKDWLLSGEGEMFQKPPVPEAIPLTIINWLLTRMGEPSIKKVSEDKIMWQRVADILKTKKGEKKEDVLKIAQEIAEYIDPATEKIIVLLKDMDKEKRLNILKIIELLISAFALTEEELKWLSYYRRAQQLSPERLEYAIRIMEGVFRGLGLMEEEEKLRVAKKKEG